MSHAWYEPVNVPESVHAGGMPPVGSAPWLRYSKSKFGFHIMEPPNTWLKFRLPPARHADAAPRLAPNVVGRLFHDAQSRKILRPGTMLPVMSRPQPVPPATATVGY